MKFKELLLKKHITQIQLATQLGVTQSLISQWIRGDCQPKLKMVVKLADILKVDVQEVIDCFK